MGNIGAGEVLVILLVGLIVLGPTKLPSAVRQVGRFVGEIRRISAGFRQELRDAVDEPLKQTKSTLAAANPANVIKTAAANTPPITTNTKTPPVTASTRAAKTPNSAKEGKPSQPQHPDNSPNKGSSDSIDTSSASGDGTAPDPTTAANPKADSTTDDASGS